jgi:hypothetical protein
MITMGTKWGLWYSGQDEDANGLQCEYTEQNWGSKKDWIVPLLLKSDFIDKGKMG